MWLESGGRGGYISSDNHTCISDNQVTVFGKTSDTD